MNIKELWTYRKWLREGTVFYHNQIWKNDKYYIYAVDLYDDFRHAYYEVFERKVLPCVLNVDGKLIKSDSDFYVKYPNNEAFGKWAITCPKGTNLKVLIEALESDRGLRDIHMVDNLYSEA